MEIEGTTGVGYGPIGYPTWKDMKDRCKKEKENKIKEDKIKEDKIICAFLGILFGILIGIAAQIVTGKPIGP